MSNYDTNREVDMQIRTQNFYTNFRYFYNYSFIDSRLIQMQLDKSERKFNEIRDN